MVIYLNFITYLTLYILYKFIETMKPHLLEEEIPILVHGDYCRLP